MHKAMHTFMDRNGWANAGATPIAGDLSVRKYFRLTRDGATAVLMDASEIPESVPPFLFMTTWLQGLGLSAPAVLAQDQSAGLLLLEDLGSEPVSTLVSRSESVESALDLAMELLLTIRAGAPPVLPRPTAEELCAWTQVADAHVPGALAAPLNRIRDGLIELLHPLCQADATVSLRDFHADNLMWLPDRSGVARMGLLDYQDAMLTHPVYDLVSLLTDARTEISRGLRNRYIRNYARMSGDDPDELARAFAVFSIQRNLRILGIFHRAAEVDGKSHHLPKVPRVYRYIEEAFLHPALVHLQDDFAKALPQPEGA